MAIGRVSYVWITETKGIKSFTETIPDEMAYRPIVHDFNGVTVGGLTVSYGSYQVIHEDGRSHMQWRDANRSSMPPEFLVQLLLLGVT